ncbi:transporter [Xanthobacter autotrophicus]|uniref:transporter n=1 Tax=Xanthobacter TaxID=279 RepID=UPI0024AB96B3|nr:transporter [Xanthobacter autotrophicus]MDI4664271.1 transporter [Xanthobacter autotrophicus]
MKATAVGTLMLLAGAGMAHAGSVTQPGETVGLATGAPLPEGLYFVNTADWGCRNTSPDTTCVGVDIPVLAWASPVFLFGGRLQLLAAVPVVEVGVENADYISGFYNPWFAAQLAWNLGNGFGFSYLAGFYLGVDTGVAFDSTSFNQRFALSYTADGWNLTANAIWGIQAAGDTNTINPDFLNVDLTATKKIGKFEIGPVAYYSTDLNSPVPLYRKQSQFAVGGLVGYDFGPVIAQAYLTTDVYEENYGGTDTRGWFRLIVPLWNPPPAQTALLHK